MTAFERERLCVGVGWHPIVDRLNEQLLELVPDYEVTQIKEKFGGLRYYVALPAGLPQETWDQAFDLIRQAELAADKTCEDCGTTENVTTAGPGWIRTLCDGCRATWMQAREERLHGLSAE